MGRISIPAIAICACCVLAAGASAQSVTGSPDQGAQDGTGTGTTTAIPVPGGEAGAPPSGDGGVAEPIYLVRGALPPGGNGGAGAGRVQLPAAFSFGTEMYPDRAFSHAVGGTAVQKLFGFRRIGRIK